MSSTQIIDNHDANVENLKMINIDERVEEDIDIIGFLDSLDNVYVEVPPKEKSKMVKQYPLYEDIGSICQEEKGIQQFLSDNYYDELSQLNDTVGSPSHSKRRLSTGYSTKKINRELLPVFKRNKKVLDYSEGNTSDSSLHLSCNFYDDTSMNESDEEAGSYKIPICSYSDASLGPSKSKKGLEEATGSSSNYEHSKKCVGNDSSTTISIDDEHRLALASLTSSMRRSQKSRKEMIKQREIFEEMQGNSRESRLKGFLSGSRVSITTGLEQSRSLLRTYLTQTNVGGL